MKHVFNAVISLLLMFIPNVESHAQDSSTAILAGNLMDVAEGILKKDVLIVIKDGKILRLGAISEKDNYPNLIDLSEYTVLPGLIDCHTHLTMNSYDKSFEVWEVPIAAHGIIGTVNAKLTLEAGFTTVRDVWGHFYSDVALRDEIHKSTIPGPRMYVSGPALSITGGHGDWETWMSPQLELKQDPAAVADGVEEVRKEVRLHIRNKVDLIKIAATGGFSTSTIPGAASYSIAEMQVAVEEAQKNGLKVAAHAHGAEGIKNAIKAGVHSIEHGTLIDDEALDMMKERKVYLVMDLLSAHYDLFELNRQYTDKKLEKGNQELYAQLEMNFKKAYDKGVKMAFGSDSGVFPHGRNAEQFRLMENAGMPPKDILKTATINAAELIGIEDQVGTIEAGKWADIIAVKGNPLNDITVLENIAFVMKSGIIYKQE